MWKQKVAQYFADPRRHWPPAQQRQATKLSRKLEALDPDREAVTRRIIRIADQRMTARPPTVFLANCGSSGSHWLGLMLAELRAITFLGEVYLPPQLLEESAEWDAREREAFVDSIHLAHSTGLDVLTPSSTLINSAHSWKIVATIAPSTTILLARDPIDIALSRTFRKPEYRAYVAPDATDVEYLDRNIHFVANFYKQAARHSPGLTVHYESLRRDPPAVLAEICAYIGVDATSDEIDEACNRHQVDGATANKYNGEDVSVPIELQRRAAMKLHTVREQLGYSETSSEAT